jgi:hypothetical protein
MSELVGESFAENLERMFRELLRFDVDEVAAGNNDVGVDVVSEFVDRAADVVFHLLYCE